MTAPDRPASPVFAGASVQTGMCCVARVNGVFCACAVDDPRTVCLADPDLQRERERLLDEARVQQATAPQRRRQRAAKEARRGPV